MTPVFLTDRDLGTLFPEILKGAEAGLAGAEDPAEGTTAQAVPRIILFLTT